MSQPQTEQVEDPFDTLLTLEDTLYTSAYDLGVKDGARAGRIEGRIFGLEKGFEKFAAMGALHGRACVWGARLPSSVKKEEENVANSNRNKVVEETDSDKKESQEGGEKTGLENSVPKQEKKAGIERKVLPPLPSNTRLEKHISMLHGLTDPSTFSTENNEEAVADFDDRFKRAGAKAKVIDRVIGENDSSSPADEMPKTPKKGRSMKISGEGKKDDSMEDFAGSRLLA